MSRKVAELYVVPDNVAWLDDDSAERQYLTVVPQGRTVILEGTARVIWLIASEGERSWSRWRGCSGYLRLTSRVILSGSWRSCWMPDCSRRCLLE